MLVKITITVIMFVGKPWDFNYIAYVVQKNNKSINFSLHLLKVFLYSYSTIHISQSEFLFENLICT